jgi:hypothetical protein
MSFMALLVGQNMAPGNVNFFGGIVFDGVSLWLVPRSASALLELRPVPLPPFTETLSPTKGCWFFPEPLCFQWDDMFAQWGVGVVLWGESAVGVGVRVRDAVAASEALQNRGPVRDTGSMPPRCRARLPQRSWPLYPTAP